jgi:hypothetical protein
MKDALGVEDKVGLGRTATIWWTQNCKFNAVHDVHRLNVDAPRAAEALDIGVDSYRGVRQAFARDCPDLVAQQIVLRTELNMCVVMPSVVRHSVQYPFMATTRLEVGTGGGNLHAHGFSDGSDAPVMPRRIKAQVVDHGDESSDIGCEDEERESEHSHEEIIDAPTRLSREVDGEIAADAAVSFAGVDSISEGGPTSLSAYEDDSCSDVQSLLLRVIDGYGYGEDMSLIALVGSVCGQDAHERSVAELRSLILQMVDDGKLQCVNGEIDCFKRVPPVSVVPCLPRDGAECFQRSRRGKTRLRASRLDEPGAEVRKSVFRQGVGNKDDVEKTLSDVFAELLSTWNPCFSEDGVCRFDWDEDVGAHDVQVSQIEPPGETLSIYSEVWAQSKVPHRWPERVSLSGLLSEVLGADGEERAEVDVQPLRRLVSALVQTSARHGVHGKDPPRFGVHACARGKDSCPKCR